MEDELLLKAQSQYKGNWETISSIINTDKNPQECKKRLAKLSSEKNHYSILAGAGGGWDLELDNKISKLHK
jgi:hypothetical protein